VKGHGSPGDGRLHRIKGRCFGKEKLRSSETATRTKHPTALKSMGFSGVNLAKCLVFNVTAFGKVERHMHR